MPENISGCLGNSRWLAPNRNSATNRPHVTIQMSCSFGCAFKSFFELISATGPIASEDK
jgi:hypothetical protein